MGTSHSQSSTDKKDTHFSSKSSRRAHSANISTTSLNSKTLSIPVNQHHPPKQNPKPQYYTTTTNTYKSDKNKIKQKINPYQQNNSFARTMSQSKSLPQINLQQKHASDITYDKLLIKQSKGNGTIMPNQNSFFDTKTSIKNDTFVVQIKTPSKQGSETIRSIYKLPNNQSKSKRPPIQKPIHPNSPKKQKTTSNQYQLSKVVKQLKTSPCKNPYANQYGSFY